MLAVGDLADGPGDLDACVRMLDAAGAVVVSGSHSLGEDDMNPLTEDDYGYALEVNDVLQDMLRRDPQPRLVVKGHTHRRAIWSIEQLTLVNPGTLLDHGSPGAMVLDVTERLAHRFDGPCAVPDDPPVRPLPL